MQLVDHDRYASLLDDRPHERQVGHDLDHRTIGPRLSLANGSAEPVATVGGIRAGDDAQAASRMKSGP